MSTSDPAAPRNGAATVVTELDAERLLDLLRAQSRKTNQPRTLPELRRKLDEAEWHDSRQIPPDLVTMNSTVRLRHLASGEESVRTLGFPGGADPGQRRVSILTPLGISLLGRRAGDEVEWTAADVVNRCRIEEVIYQPEAAEDFDW